MGSEAPPLAPPRSLLLLRGQILFVPCVLRRPPCRPSPHPSRAFSSALVSLRRPSCPFVDNSFPFVFFRLFQASGAPALPCRSYKCETIRNRPIPSRPWYPVTVHLNALVALRRPSCVFVDHSFSFVFFRLFQARQAISRWQQSSCAESAQMKPPIVPKGRSG